MQGVDKRLVRHLQVAASLIIVPLGVYVGVLFAEENAQHAKDQIKIQAEVQARVKKRLEQVEGRE